MESVNIKDGPASIAGALLVSNDGVTIEQIRESMRELAVSSEVCAEVPGAVLLLNERKFEAVIIDLQMGSEANSVLEKVRFSPSNRTAVIFTVSNSDAETGGAFKAGSNFVLRRPLSMTSIGRIFKVGYGMILRERRRYFRCPVEVAVAISRPGLPVIRGQTLNISESGIAIVSAVPLSSGTEVELHFTLPSQELKFIVGATVCWRKESNVGLEFSSIAPELSGILQEWLLQRLEQSLPGALAQKFRNSDKTSH